MIYLPPASSRTVNHEYKYRLGVLQIYLRDLFEECEKYLRKIIGDLTLS